MVFVGKDGNQTYEMLERPLNLFSFEAFAFDEGITVSNYLDNRDGSYEDYYTISTRIKQIIKGDQVEGAMVGQYNANLTARINNIKEQTENVNTNHNISIMNIDPIDKQMD